MNTAISPHNLVRIILSSLAGLIIVAIVTVCGVHAAKQEPLLQLLTVEEASRPASRSYGFASSLQDEGPIIEVSELEVTEAKPFALVVKLSPRDNTAFDPTTMRVECLVAPVKTGER